MLNWTLETENDLLAWLNIERESSPVLSAQNRLYSSHSNSCELIQNTGIVCFIFIWIPQCSKERWEHQSVRCAISHIPTCVPLVKFMMS